MSSVLDAAGNPMRRAAAPAPADRGSLVTSRPGFRASLSGGSLTPYDAADPGNRDFAGWMPWLGSPDTEVNPYRNNIVARIRDLVRNDGWASGGITKLVDTVIGGHVQLVVEPSLAFLQRFSPGFDESWAEEYAAVVESRWDLFAESDIGGWSDISRRLDFSGMAALAFRTRLIDGDAMAISHWEPDRVGLGRAQYATCFQLIDPDRLSNPQMVPDQAYLRGGVQIDDYGAAIGYHFRRAHPADWFVFDRAYAWEYVERETPWGRPIVVHDFDHDRPAQHRAAGGVLKPVVGKFRQLGQYDATELQAAIVNAVLAAWIESPFDHGLLAEGLEGSPDELRRQLLPYQSERAAFHREQPMLLNGVRVPLMYPGEKINTLSTVRPATNFADFEAAILRNISGVMTGLGASELSGNWAEVNFSAAKAAQNLAYRSIERMRRHHFERFCTPLYSNWLEEEFERGDLPLPPNAPDFLEARGAYCGCEWYGPGRGWLDPLAERRGEVLGLDAGFDTLKGVCAAQGKNWRKVVRQRAIEFREFERLKLPHPTWQSAADDAQKASQAPEAQ